MRFVLALTSLVLAACLLGATACSTAPREKNREDFQTQATASLNQFKRSVNGLDAQIGKSAGYIIFPNVSQLSIIFAGGTYGRGGVYRPDGSQIGWAALNTGYVGIGAGVQGFRMLMVLEDDATLKKFMDNQLGGNVNANLVAIEAGGSATARFQNGVVVYEGANKGLIAGMDIGMNYIRYKPFEPPPADK